MLLFRLAGCTCICGSCRVTVLGEPLKTTLCHCQDCRRWTGSVGQLAIWHRQDDVLCSGKLVEFVTGARVRKSCARCRSHILTSLPKAGLIELCVASKISLQAHFFYVTPLIDIKDDVPKFVDFPASLGGSGVQAESWEQCTDNLQVFYGSCPCGAIAVSISAEPTTTIFCHCRECRSWTGSCGHLAVVFEASLVQIAGELISVGHGGRRNCAKCSACIASAHSPEGPEAPNLLEVCGGILNAPPRVQAHWKYSERILSIKDGCAKFKDFPKDMGGSGDVLGQEVAPYAVTLFRKDEDLGLEFSFVGRKCRVLKVRRHSLIHAARLALEKGIM
ncbi:unnamed protein product [Symbiodinium pilosum]|uniref:CENP-V/GFA domain-containing protein n=1 Tax=Symbiodinium pilosum TaxID=2952 RepID=A0A812TNK6_SYMPI|nr:unnamed protein product [Symbiodinium pilosum]